MKKSDPAYYNEPDPFAAAWLRNLMQEDLIPHGHIDTREIQKVKAADFQGYKQCHFFAGIGGWPLALRIAGWPDGKSVWTGSCPCPPFSVAGKRKGCPQCASEDIVPSPSQTGFFLCCACGEAWLADARHIWPEWWRLIRDARPDCPIFGEQVTSKSGRAWLSIVRATLAILGYGAWGADLCSAGVGKDHIRQRLYWVAYANSQADGGRGNNKPPKGFGARQGRPQQRPSGFCASVGGADSTTNTRSQGRRNNAGQYSHKWNAVAESDVTGRVFAKTTDGKYRPIPATAAGVIEPTLFPLVTLGAVRNRVGILRGAGNLIDPFVAAEWITACADVLELGL